MDPHLITDQPIEIGYKCSWFAVRDADLRALATAFSVGDIYPCNWKFGMAAAKEGSLFISPAVRGWRLVVGNLLPFGDSNTSIDTVKMLLKRSSQVATEAQFFATHRVSEFHCWMKTEAGVPVRAYAYVGDRMEILIDEGLKTTAEPSDLISAKEIALMEADEDVEVSFPDEDLVMSLAAAWSVDPNAFSDEDVSLGLGVVGTTPSRFI
jgi:hypothetical protein